ncbi:glycosyltransferase [Variovorax sp. LT1R20]|uniref:glycosyltransferase n=1 Tax=Variovorax sp. LT1R20 TaxID=3443729 RepID=UPI003F46B690
MNKNESIPNRPAHEGPATADDVEKIEGGSASAFEALLEAANERANAALTQQREIQNSISWRITAPLRKAADAMPEPMRANLRRGAKAAWWALTPWRMPERLRALRMKRPEEASLGGTPDPEDAYGAWIAGTETRSALAGDAPQAPQLSFLLAAERDPEALLRTLASLRSQASRRWEALVAVETGDAGAAIQSALDTLAKEPRIVRVAVPEGSRSRGLAVCAAQATGEFVALLEAGDIVAAGALDEIASALARAPHSDIVYGDEDEISAEGFRQNPYFKPGWSPDLLYAFNYFGRLTLLRASVVRAAGGVDPTLEAGAEWDLNLRASEQAGVVTRIPKVLCHRKTGGNRERAGPQTPEAAGHREALRRHWVRHGVDAAIETQPDGTQRATWALAHQPLVSIIVPTKDKVDLLRTCIDGLLTGTDYGNTEIILVDTGSVELQTQAYYEELRHLTQVSIVHFSKKFNYSAACNHGASFARGELLLFLNNDIEVLSRDWLQEMVRFAQRPGVGVVGTQLLYPDGQLQHGGVGVGVHLCGLMYRSAESGAWGVFGSADHPRNWLAIMGACQLVSREAFERVGGFDEAYLVACSDVALCLNIWRAGYRTAYAPHARLRHHEGATRGTVNPTLDMQRLADDIRLLGIDEDPYLHPELDAREPIPALRLGGAPTVRESLMADTRALGSLMLPATVLDLSNDRTCLEAAGLPREDVVWPPEPAHRIADTWSAARWCLDLLRTRPDIARRFPQALSGGTDGEFGRWIANEGGKALHLSGSARALVAGCLSMDLGARARQTYLFHDDIKTPLPHGLLPTGQFELFQWFMRQGRQATGLRLEEVWWLLREASEQPAVELLRAYAFAPAWQTLYPDGLTMFGRRAFAAWFGATYRVKDAWADPTHWQVDMTPAAQIRTAYLAREDWRLQHPRALDDARHATVLIEWLATPAAAQSAEVAAWCAALDTAQVAAEMVAPGVNVIGHFSYPSGLRVSVEALVEGLQRVGVQTSLRDLKTDRKDDPTHAKFDGFEDFGTTLIHAQPEPFFDQAFARSDLHERSPRTYRIGYWYWEFDSIPESWVAHAEKVDEVWAATEFVARGLRARLAQPVRTLFPGVKLGPFERRPRSYFGLRDEPYTFLFTFHMMSVMERKNPIGLIRAFARAFGDDDTVQLVLKTSFGDRHPQQFEALQAAAAAAANVTIINEVYSPEDVLSLMDACDAYVSLHRSEGLGLTMAEAMLMGKPVIATNFSGNVDFMDSSNSLLVDYELVKLGKSIPPYDAHLEWAEPSEAHAAELMRRVFDNQAWAAELGAAAKASAERALSLDVAGQKAADRLAEIRAQQRDARNGRRDD